MSRRYIPCPLLMRGLPCHYGDLCRYNHIPDFIVDVLRFSKNIYNNKYIGDEIHDELDEIRDAAKQSSKMHGRRSKQMVLWDIADEERRCDM